MAWWNNIGDLGGDIAGGLGALLGGGRKTPLPGPTSPFPPGPVGTGSGPTYPGAIGSTGDVSQPVGSPSTDTSGIDWTGLAKALGITALAAYQLYNSAKSSQAQGSLQNEALGIARDRWNAGKPLRDAGQASLLGPAKKVDLSSIYTDTTNPFAQSRAPSAPLVGGTPIPIGPSAPPLDTKPSILPNPPKLLPLPTLPPGVGKGVLRPRPLSPLFTPSF